MIELIQGDCLIESESVESGSIDLILSDLPYGNMNTDGGQKMGIHSWDIVIDTDRIMQIANRVLRKNGKMVLTAQQPFTNELITKAIPNLPFNYSMIWEKDSFANPLGAKKAPVNYYEDILVFTKKHSKHDFDGLHPLREYFMGVLAFIGLNLKGVNNALGHRRAEHAFYVGSTQFSLCTEKTYLELIGVFGIDRMDGFKSFEELRRKNREYRNGLLKNMNERYPSTFNLHDGKKYKSNILKYKKDYDGFHPTQKPVLLLEDLIKTYTNEGDTVLDFTMGSGSTGVACKNTNRNFIGIEQEEKYYKIAQKRIFGELSLFDNYATSGDNEVGTV